MNEMTIVKSIKPINSNKYIILGGGLFMALILITMLVFIKINTQYEEAVESFQLLSEMVTNAQKSKPLSPLWKLNIERRPKTPLDSIILKSI